MFGVTVGAGTTVATCTAPLLPPKTVTFAVRLPVLVGGVEKVTVSEFAVALVTVPIAPRLKTTVLFAAVVSKFVPAITIVVAFCARFAVFGVTVGGATIVATCVGPVVPVTVTVAFSGPGAVGCDVNVTVNCVALAAVTLPAAPLSNTTESLASVVEKPFPLMTIVGAFCARFAAFGVMPKGGCVMVMVKFCVAVPTEFVAVTVPVNVPVAFGFPLITPALLIVSPPGNAPLVTLSVGVGDPVNV